MKLHSERSSWFVAIAIVLLVGATAAAIDLEVNPRTIEAVLKVARGPEAQRAEFHRGYVFPAEGLVETVEVITEVRRLLQLAEARIAGGDHLFVHGTRAAQDALRPWRRRVSIVARLRFHPQNAYVMAPPVELTMYAGSRRVPALDARSESILGLSSGNPDERLPVVGAKAEAVFAADAVAQEPCVVIVQAHGEQLARVAMDFSRLP
jgi:hypothetical protein